MSKSLVTRLAMSRQKIHYVVVGSPLTFCGTDLHNVEWEECAGRPDEFKQALLRGLFVCHRCAKAHAKQLEVQMGIDDATWENTP
jgi:hypothetical protein